MLANPYHQNPSPLVTALTVTGIAAGIFVVGMGVAKAAEPRGGLQPTGTGKLPSTPPPRDLPPDQTGIVRWVAQSCDIAPAGENAFVDYMATVSRAQVGSWPPPRHRDEAVLVAALRQAFPTCAWPPTDPNWRAHGDQPGEAVAWPRFVELIGNMFDEVARGELPWGPGPDYDHQRMLPS